MFPATLQFLITMIACAINERFLCQHPRQHLPRLRARALFAGNSRQLRPDRLFLVVARGWRARVERSSRAGRSLGGYAIERAGVVARARIDRWPTRSIDIAARGRADRKTGPINAQELQVATQVQIDEDLSGVPVFDVQGGAAGRKKHGELYFCTVRVRRVAEGETGILENQRRQSHPVGGDERSNEESHGTWRALGGWMR